MERDLVIQSVAVWIEIGAVVVLVSGLVLSIGVFLRSWRGQGLDESYHSFRANLGRSILLGLEILIVADIIRTVAMHPTIDNLLVLGFIIVLRTFLSFALEIEIGGRLPWRREPHVSPHQAGTSV